MLIVKPYGRSETVNGKDGPLLRQLRRRPKDCGPYDIPEFAGSHAELLVAQWVSVLDKIACKPAGRKPPTPEQRRLREALAEAAWTVLEARLPDERKDKLRDLWRRKAHPYGDRDDNSVSGREKGRWYDRFAGGVDPDRIGREAAARIARGIEEHLHETEYRLHPARPNKRKGRIAARAASIAGNVAAPVRESPRAGWADGDIARYRAAGDVAAAIRRAAEALEAKRRRVGPAVAAEALFSHYGKLFRRADGEPLPIAEAKEREPGLFALHMAARETYTRILKNHGKDKREHGERGKGRRPVSALLPEDMDALFRLAGAMGRNRDLAALVRLGKLIHYEAAPARNAGAAAGDAPAYAIDRWSGDGDIDRSRYRTSAGQSEIKRNEAFARVWRGVAALAHRAATDWADPNGEIDRDIWGRNEIERACGERFEEDSYAARLAILFGNRARLFREAADGRNVLRLALEGWAALRNGAFHFKGRGEFARVLKQGLESRNNEASAAVRKLLETDIAERRARLVASLRAAHVEHYYTPERLAALLEAVTAGAPAKAPLPRCRRVLDRADNAWKKHGEYRLRLPGPGNRRDMEANPGRLSRYILLKTLYERAFPAWLEARDAAALNGWIGRAAERATKDARTINEDPDAAARSSGLIELGKKEDIADFMDRLAAETATEYRVQRGYESDPEAARKQAKYLEDLRCDVVGQAFEAYLDKTGLDWTMEALPDGPLPERKTADLDDIAPPETENAGSDAEDWQALLYFLIHLAPVEAASGLRHQLRKLSVLERKADPDAGADPDVEAVEWLLALYLDMHDAKFEGGEGVAGAEALKGLFVSNAQFRRACPEGADAGAGSHVPWRGLREMLRFGGGEPKLMPVFGERTIDAAMLDRLEASKNGIADAHEQREELHARWVKKKKLSREDREAYREALGRVVAHRHLAAQVHLVNHARLHRLAMAVLGRLADYAGLWERDLYFATLALVRLEGKEPKDVFRSKGLNRLREGRIVEALEGLKKEDDGSDSTVLKALQAYFGEDVPEKNGIVKVRNDFMHFNMLQREENKPFDLTAAVNDARRLMAYDRKLKNAVSRSIIELLAREDLDLAWKMEGHRLADAMLKSRQAHHLGGREIAENLHGPEFVAMAAALFGGKAESSSASRPSAKDGANRNARKAGGGPRVLQPVALQSPLPAPGERVQAVLVPEKTKKGGWKAAVEAGGRRIVGDIYNSGEVPPDAAPGLETELVVRVANPKNASFEWPSPEVAARLAKPKAGRRGGRPGGRRR